MRNAMIDDPTRGLVVYRASRLEALLDPLLTLLDQAPPPNVLVPQTVIAAHPGMRQWLSGALARRRGPGGIVANLDICLPSAWLDDLAQSVLGEAAVALRPYRRERLRWRIHELLADIDDPQLRGYLAGGDPARRRYQLADRLARLYSQYLVYRPDWLRAWQAGRDEVPEASFMAPLWRALRKAIDRPHRAEVLQSLLDSLRRQAPAKLPREPLHVFGVSHLAPAELAVLAAMARHRLVVLYVPDPCREYWAGLRGELAQLRTLAQRIDAGDAAETWFLEESGHPLLASWGRMGQHFMLALSERTDIRLDVRHWQDEDPAVPPLHTLLQRLQESIRRLAPALLQPGQGATAVQDRSLRVHLCHTRLRELEVLRDVLLNELAEHPDLQPSDIVVMAPDIAAYVPLLPAVFGEAGRAQGPLPYHLADVAVARVHPLLQAFCRLLDMPDARLGAPELLDLLQVPEIARALALGEDERDTLTRWLRQSRVAWALDGEHRARFGVPAIEETTFAWGMDRLLAGYAMGDDAAAQGEAWTLPDGELWPVEGVHGPQTQVLGALDRLLLELAALQRDAAQPRTASAWAARLEQLLDALLRVDPRDGDATEALSLLRRLIQATAVEAGDCGLDPKLEFVVVRDVLRERLAAAPERQRFLLGGVTFCGMVPQRAIPFRVVAVLGLNDGEFPRNPSDAGLDLMQRYRRLGDRDVRSDDRYLFLETVMAARDVLHLSYLGEGVRDGKPRNPAAPLAELMQFLDEQAGGRAVEADIDEQPPAPGEPRTIRRPWRIRHPLQPFDARYFDDVDPRLFSFDAGFAAMRAGGAQRAPFLDGAPVEPGEAEALPVPLREVQSYFRDPSRQLLAQQLHVCLDALEDDRLQGREPLQAGLSALERVPQRLFFEAIGSDRFDLPEDPPAWLRLGGVLPPGRIGLDAWTAERARVQTLLARAADHPLFAGAMPRRTPVQVAQTIAGFGIEGSLERVWATSDARWQLEVYPGKDEKSLGFRERIPFFIEWALLRLCTDARTPVRACLLADGEPQGWERAFNGWDETFVAHAGDEAACAMRDDLAARLGALLGLWRQAQHYPLPYFPKTSWAALDERTDKAQQAWAGSFGHPGERDYAPGYAWLLAGDADFSPEQPAFAGLQGLATELWDLINLNAARETCA